MPRKPAKLTCTLFVREVNETEEREWSTIPPDEQKKIAEILNDTAMAAIGYRRMEPWEVEELERKDRIRKERKAALEEEKKNDGTIE